MLSVPTRADHSATQIQFSHRMTEKSARNMSNKHLHLVLLTSKIAAMYTHLVGLLRLGRYKESSKGSVIRNNGNRLYFSQLGYQTKTSQMRDGEMG